MNAVRGDLSCLKDEWNEKEAKATQQFAEPLPKNCLPGSIVWGNKRINLNNVR